MNMWNSVIHASLKRKLDGLAAENTVTNGVSALLHAAPGIISHVGAPALPHMRSGRTPTEVVAFLLQSFVKDALVGAKNFIELASEVNHVKRSTPHRLVLFVGDNENYRPLLRITHYDIHTARYEGSGQRCVLRADVYGTAERAAFDFQLSCEDGEWLIDEVFRL